MPGVDGGSGNTQEAVALRRQQRLHLLSAVANTDCAVTVDIADDGKGIMRIAFYFNAEKAIQAIAYLLQGVGVPTDKVKLTKLLYLADRQSFIETGVSITGDHLVAMPYGPVPSGCLDLLNGEPRVSPDRVFRFIHVDDNKVSLRCAPDYGLLSAADRSVLDQIARQHGNTDTWELMRATHELPEFREHYVAGTSQSIPFEAIARASGDPRRFRLNRPVISPQTAEAMPCPFEPGADATL
jgi:hypothetical protein